MQIVKYFWQSYSSSGGISNTRPPVKITGMLRTTPWCSYYHFYMIPVNLSLCCMHWEHGTGNSFLGSTTRKKNSMEFGSQTNYTDWRPPLVGKILVPTIAERRVLLGKRDGSTRPLITVSLDWGRYISFQEFLFILTSLNKLSYRPINTHKIW
jgi:hypothetical protein